MASSTSMVMAEHIEKRTWFECELASAGFYYTGVSNFVCCFECGVKINDWTLGDTPWLEHHRNKPSCKFVRRIPCANVPVADVSRLDHREFLSLFDYVPPPYPDPHPEIDLKTAKVRQYLTDD
ncbi:baculoviral IAP repeat-containing protein 2-like [Aphidius gifuensis]|uniref:baculoviral IAP repeat-containing protein 2-like n=1 Tax=Aphidius gifuensis TaxID=684658 RepID=UPI001CDD16D6|nr:baculoviral IAP repeat-containing protein 2-like [Aphidius gifuensis]